MAIAIHNLDNIVLDGKPGAKLEDVLRDSPARAADVAAALRAREAKLIADAADFLQLQLKDVAAAHARELTAKSDEIATLQARFAPPPPLPDYYLIVEVTDASARGTHAGILQPPAIKGAWTFDLLNEEQDGYRIVAREMKAPASEKLTSLSEITAEQATTDISAALASSLPTPASRLTPSP